MEIPIGIIRKEETLFGWREFKKPGYQNRRQVGSQRLDQDLGIGGPGEDGGDRGVPEKARLRGMSMSTGPQEGQRATWSGLNIHGQVGNLNSIGSTWVREAQSMQMHATGVELEKIRTSMSDAPQEAFHNEAVVGAAGQRRFGKGIHNRNLFSSLVSAT